MFIFLNNRYRSLLDFIILSNLDCKITWLSNITKKIPTHQAVKSILYPEFDAHLALHLCQRFGRHWPRIFTKTRKFLKCTFFKIMYFKGYIKYSSYIVTHLCKIHSESCGCKHQYRTKNVRKKAILNHSLSRTISSVSKIYHLIFLFRIHERKTLLGD